MGEGDKKEMTGREALEAISNPERILDLAEGAVNPVVGTVASKVLAIDDWMDNEEQLRQQRIEFAAYEYANKIRNRLSWSTEPYEVHESERALAEWAVEHGELEWHQQGLSVRLPAGKEAVQPLLTCPFCRQLSKPTASSCRSCGGLLVPGFEPGHPNAREPWPIKKGLGVVFLVAAVIYFITKLF